MATQCFERPIELQRIEGIGSFEEIRIAEIRHEIGDQPLGDTGQTSGLDFGVWIVAGVDLRDR